MKFIYLCTLVSNSSYFFIIFILNIFICTNHYFKKTVYFVGGIYVNYSYCRDGTVNNIKYRRNSY